MFAEKVFVVEILGDAGRFGIGGGSLKSHGGDFFDDHGDMGSLRRSCAPAGRGVAGDEHRWRAEGIELCEAAHDGVARVGFVIGDNLRGRKRARDGDRAMEVVRVRSAEARDFAAGLRPGGSGTGMRVRDSTNLVKRFIEN